MTFRVTVRVEGYEVAVERGASLVDPCNDPIAEAARIAAALVEHARALVAPPPPVATPIEPNLLLCGGCGAATTVSETHAAVECRGCRLRWSYRYAADSTRLARERGVLIDMRKDSGTPW